MSELKATPAPWTEGVDGNMRVYAPDGMGDQSGLIATVYKSRANTKLIAAAPELYEALADLVDAFDDGEHGFCPARAALAKARGQ